MTTKEAYTAGRKDILEEINSLKGIKDLREYRSQVGEPDEILEYIDTELKKIKNINQ